MYQANKRLVDAKNLYLRLANILTASHVDLNMIEYRMWEMGVNPFSSANPNDVAENFTYPDSHNRVCLKRQQTDRELPSL